MAIKKQEFYEGAAIHRLACSGGLKSIAFEDPFFLFNKNVLVYFKYSTKKRSPWGFTFSPEESELLRPTVTEVGRCLTVALVCGVDGVAALEAREILEVGFSTQMRLSFGKRAAVRVACFRNHGEYYEVRGPEGVLSRKVSPSDWTRLLGKKRVPLEAL